MCDAGWDGCCCAALCLDVSFMTCLPSQLAASCVSAAASGLLGHVWCRHVDLLRRLHQLTNVDIVSDTQSLYSTHNFTVARKRSRLNCNQPIEGLPKNNFIMSPDRIEGSNKHCFCPSILPSVRPSVAYIANNSRTQRPSVPKFWRKVPRLRCDSHTSFKVEQSKVRVRGGREHNESAERGGHTGCCVCNVILAQFRGQTWSNTAEFFYRLRM